MIEYEIDWNGDRLSIQIDGLRPAEAHELSDAVTKMCDWWQANDRKSDEKIETQS